MDTLTDKCHFCDNTAEYNDIAKVEGNGYVVSSVCKKHLIMGLSS